MIGVNYYERLRCNWCGSEFDEQWLSGKTHLEDEKCPVCKRRTFICHKFKYVCIECTYTLGLTDEEAEEFITSGKDGDCLAVRGERYYLLDGEIYCNECWNKLTKEVSQCL